MKACFKCHLTLPLDAFYKHAAMADGHLGKCKECTKRDATAVRLAKIEHYRSYDRMRASQPHRVAAREAYSGTEARRLATNANQKAYRIANLKKSRARTTLSNAVRDGRLEKWPCQICGDMKSQGHHCDYDRPLDVVWLCSTHHSRLHKEHRENLRKAQ